MRTTVSLPGRLTKRLINTCATSVLRFRVSFSISYSHAPFLVLLPLPLISKCAPAAF